MLYLCGFELYPRWVPLNKLWQKRTAVSAKIFTMFNSSVSRTHIYC